MINIHRVFLPGIHGNGDGMIADTRYFLDGEEIVVEDFTVHVVLDKKVGKEISSHIDISTYYTILQYSLNEIKQIYKKDNGSEY